MGAPEDGTLQGVMMDEAHKHPFLVEERRPVWSALSSLFLDTDTTLFTERIVSTLAESPYSLNELDAILIDEVYPVCHLNLFSVAGEWAGFDEEALEKRILHRLSSRNPFRHLLNLGRITVPTSLHWRRIKRLVTTKRSHGATSIDGQSASGAG